MKKYKMLVFAFMDNNLFIVFSIKDQRNLNSDFSYRQNTHKCKEKHIFSTIAVESENNIIFYQRSTSCINFIYFAFLTVY